MHCSNHGTLITTAITSHANTPKSVLSLTLTSGNRECKLQTTVKHAQHNGVQYRTFICAHYHQHPAVVGIPICLHTTKLNNSYEKFAKNWTQAICFLHVSTQVKASIP